MKRTENKKRRCMSCGKLLLNEKLPFCARCQIEGGNKVAEVGGLVATGVAVAIVAKNKIKK